ncbi:hypothetical protein [Geodermatophilus sabuli]|uniref:Uncharacterized protein n=1 Tax=Geodermatophilus sabuli TaxID=1564158 RepID=A0A285ED53_9ACTN|nr:hypothetical protein [Geodermatophilus sabuli]MBB3083349.1 hypothetical protein [Geodermatophilus sabuli]SNX96930.1 hypothetical protein SAMN06893097_105271 [Geodermatophilus sabuli]
MHPAAEDPQTSSALTGYQAGALRWLVGGGIAVVLGVLLGAAAVTIAADAGRGIPGVGLVVVVLVIAGTVGAIAGGGALLRHRRWRRALQAVPWQTGVLRIAGPAVLAFEPEGYDETDPLAEPVRLRLESTTVWRTRAVQQLHDAVVRAAPVGPREWVLTADGVPTVYGARVVRSR